VTSARTDIAEIADRLMAAYDDATTLPPSRRAIPRSTWRQGTPCCARSKRAASSSGWQPVGRKIGFTNRTIWPRYGVYLPMWAHVWATTAHRTSTNRATLSLARFVQPRIEPEVVFGLKASIPTEGDALAALACVDWIAPGFEIVQSHFPDWKFTAADCTAAFGLHGALVIGAPVPVTERSRASLADALPSFVLTLRRGGEVVDTGAGSNVLDSPALALVHLARVLAGQPQFPPLAPGEIVTTGTITDAWPVAKGQTWTSDYGTLGLPGMTLTFA
jgi:2-oxo-3-hexenedioate decarboxylase